MSATVVSEQHMTAIQMVTDEQASATHWWLWDPEFKYLTTEYSQPIVDTMKSNQFSKMSVSDRKLYKDEVSQIMKDISVENLMDFTSRVQQRIEAINEQKCGIEYYIAPYCIYCFEPKPERPPLPSESKACQCWRMPGMWRTPSIDSVLKFSYSITNIAVYYKKVIDHVDDAFRKDTVMSTKKWGDYYKRLRAKNSDAERVISAEIMTSLAQSNTRYMESVSEMETNINLFMNYIAHLVHLNRAVAIHNGNHEAENDSVNNAVIEQSWNQLILCKEQYEPLFKHWTWNHKLQHFPHQKLVLSPALLLIVAQYFPALKRFQDRYSVNKSRQSYLAKNLKALSEHKILMERVTSTQGRVEERIKPIFVTGCANCYEETASEQCKECGTGYCSEKCKDQDETFHAADCKRQNEATKENDKPDIMPDNLSDVQAKPKKVKSKKKKPAKQKRWGKR